MEPTLALYASTASVYNKTNNDQSSYAGRKEQRLIAKLSINEGSHSVVSQL